MAEISNIGILTAFAAGVVSFLSPCVLPLVPGYISYIAGRTTLRPETLKRQSPRLTALGLSLCFVFGFSTVFVILGASASALGRLLLRYRYEMNIVGGAIIIIFGLFLIGVIRPAWMQREVRFHASIPGGHAVSAYILGLAFAFGWTPCIGPILGAILTVGASTTSVSNGAILLAIYSLGLGVPFIFAALFTTALTARLRSISRFGYWLQLSAGAVMIVMGVAMITGHLSEFAYWLLEKFPILSKLG